MEIPDHDLARDLDSLIAVGRGPRIMNQPEILTSRLRLLPATIGDLDTLHRIWTTPAVRRFLFDDKIASREQAQELVQRSLASFGAEKFGLWTVRLTHDDQTIVGFCGLQRTSDRREVELIYGVVTELAGRGLASEAAKSVLSYGLDELGLPRIIGRTDPPNAASARVMEKAAMNFEGRISADGLELLQYAIERRSPHS